MITEKMRLREFFSRVAPATMGLIARDCGMADADDTVGALVAYSQNSGLDVIHWRVRYPELALDRGTLDGTTAARWDNRLAQSRIP